MTSLDNNIKGKKWAFDRDDRIGIGAHDYVLLQTTDDGHLLARVDNPDLTEFFAHSDIERWRRSKGFRHDPGYFSPAKQKARARSGVDTISDLPAAEQAKIMWKNFYCTEFLRMEKAGKTKRSDKKMGEAVDAIHEIAKNLDIAKVITGPRHKKDGTIIEATVAVRKKPSADSVLDWIVKLEKSGFDLRELRDGRRRSGNRDRIDADMHACMLRVIDGVFGAGDERRPNIRRIRELIEIEARVINADRNAKGEEPLTVPCEKTISKAVKALPKFALYAGRHGAAAAQKRYPSVGLGFDVTRPMQRVEIDEWKASLMALFVEAGVWTQLSKETRKKVRRVRMCLCAAIDVATKCILGMRLSETTTQENSLAVLRMIVSDKAPYADAVGALTPWDMCGTPHLIASDNGSALKAVRVQTAIVDLMGSTAHPPTGRSNLRPYIERVFGTVRTQLASRFTGQTFENVIARGDYASEGRASLTPDDLAWALVRYVVDIYHNQPHEGLGGETPREAWLRLSQDFFVKPPPDCNRMRAIFGMEHRAKLDPSGLQIFGLRYQSEALQAHFRDAGGVHIDMRVDYDDLGAISAKLGDSWHEIHCVREGMHGVSKRVWDATRKDILRRFPKDKPPAWDVVLTTIKEIMEMSAKCVDRAGLGRTILDSAAVDKAAREAMFGFEPPDPKADWPKNDGPDERDLFRDALPTDGSDDEPPPATDVAKPAPKAKRNWTIKRS